MVRSNDLCKVADRIRCIARRRSSSQIDIRRCRCIHKVQRVRSANTTVQRINTSCRKNKIIARTTDNTVIARCTCDRVTKVRSNNTCNVAQCISCITRCCSSRQIDRRCRSCIGKVYCIGSTAAINRITAHSRINQIIASAARYTVTTRTALDRIAVIGSNHLRDIAQRIRRIARRRPSRKINI